MRGHNGSVKAVAFFNDCRHVVTGSRDTTLQIWDVQSGALAGNPFKGHKGSILSVAISPDNMRIASGGEDTTI
ncbi:WD40 repeat-like protein, partial [Rhizopogon salebrosus TDB-379]